MKCISMLQPWASLVILGEKKFETRSWSTQHRDVLGIHSSLGQDWVKRLFYTEPFLSVFKKHGIEKPEQLPFGHIIGEVGMIGCKQMTADLVRARLKGKNGSGFILLPSPTSLEFSFGDWQLGRFAWEFVNPLPYIHTIPTKGSLSIWEYL